MKSVYIIIGVLFVMFAIPAIVRLAHRRFSKKKLSQTDRVSLVDIQTEIARLEIVLGVKADEAREIAEAARDKYRVKKLSELYIEEMNILKKV